METRIKITKQQAAPFVSRTFPNYCGRKFSVSFVDTMRFYDTNWSGGTKNEYAAIGSNGAARFDAPAPWVNPVEGALIAMRPDVAIVEHSYFCGKDLGITIYLHPEHGPKYITA